MNICFLIKYVREDIINWCLDKTFVANLAKSSEDQSVFASLSTKRLFKWYDDFITGLNDFNFTRLEKSECEGVKALNKLKPNFFCI